MAMAEFDEIWLFIEQKLKTQVPTYFKNILKVCGYNNGISIASIDASDIEYLEEEVRNGNVSKYFEGKDVEEVLEGSTKSIENFVFTRGHQKFLLSIVDFVKTHLQENGRDSFILKSRAVPKIKIVRGATKKAASACVIPRKRMKYSEQNNQELHGERSHVTPIENTEAIDLKKQRDILLSKTVMSLITHTPEMYVKNIEIVHTKISTGIVAVKVDKSSSESLEESVDEVIRYVAQVTCPFCSNTISVSHSSKPLTNGCYGEPWWNTSNFDRHVKIHQNNSYFDSVEQTDNIDVFENTNVAPSEDGSLIRTEEPRMESGCNMLQNFVNSAERNCARKKPGYRYDILTKMFAAFIKMLAGLLAYETLQANFPLSLPSVSTVNRFLSDHGPQIIEGDMRTDELLKYLQSKNLPLRISLSEDATRITPKISYDPNTNQLIGFVLPLDKNGMPIPLSFPARNISEIQKHFADPSNFVSSTAYVQMAQPIEPNSPSFCFMIFSTDNKFTAHNILKKWKFQAYKLKEKGIKIDNISSDGDSRPLMAMKVLSEIGQSNRSYLDCEWFSCGGYVETTFTQDVTHIITKARNRVLKVSRIYPIGNKIISSSHLKYLIEHVSKDKHLLTPSDIEPKDRQNFLSAEKVCSEKTIQCLLDFVPGSEGTAIYLKVMRSVLDAFLDTKIKSKERIYLMWYAVFFCRAWRSWILNSEKLKTPQKRAKSYYSLKENFMSSNCYTCIELNAHALVKQVLIEESSEETVEDSFEETSRNKCFFPNLYGSQVCESMFRQIRSFTSTFSTVVNCNMFDIIHRIRKIQLQNDIIAISNGKIKFPRFEKKVSNTSADSSSHESNRFKSLSRATIISEIEKSKQAVTFDLEKLGIDASKLNFHCQIQPVFEEDMLEIDRELDSDLDSDSEENEWRKEHSNFIETEAEEEIQEDINSLSGITGELMLRNYRENSEKNSNDNIHLDEKSPFVIVIDNKGKEMVVRKSSVCWLLSKDKHKLSSDRLQRVQEKEYASNNSGNKSFPSADNFILNDEISIGDWCIFSERVEEVDEDKINPVMLGLVLGFTYLNGKTFKEREYSKSSAPVQSDSNKGTGVLCNFYTFNAHGVLINVPGDKHRFINTESYIGTIKHPTYDNKILTLSQNLIEELQKL